MAVGDTITLTYYNVRVQSLTDAELTADKPADNSTRRLRHRGRSTAYCPSADGRDWRSNLQFGLPCPAGEIDGEVRQLKSRVVSVTPTPRRVKSEAVLNSVKVVYTAQAGVFGNNDDYYSAAGRLVDPLIVLHDSARRLRRTKSFGWFCVAQPAEDRCKHNFVYRAEVEQEQHRHDG